MISNSQRRFVSSWPRSRQKLPSVRDLFDFHPSTEGLDFGNLILMKVSCQNPCLGWAFGFVSYLCSKHCLARLRSPVYFRNVQGSVDFGTPSSLGLLPSPDLGSLGIMKLRKIGTLPSNPINTVPFLILFLKNKLHGNYSL